MLVVRLGLLDIGGPIHVEVASKDDKIVVPCILSLLSHILSCML